MNVALLLLVVYSVVLVAIGLWIARRVKGAGDFFVAGRRLTAPLLFSTVLAANIGAGTTIGATGLAYQEGASAWWWNGSAAIGSLFLAFFIGPRLWRIARDNGLFTAGDFLEWRYGVGVRALIAALIWVGTLFILAGQLIAGTAILEVVAGVPRWAGALLGGVIMTTYFMAGGLLSSAWVNLVQLVVLLGGFLIAVPMLLARAGGMAAIGGAAAAVPPGYTDFFHSAGPGSGWALLFLLAPGFVISPGLVQKAYGAADPRTIRLGIGAQAGVQMLFAFLPVIIGMSAHVLAPGIAVRDQVLPTVFANHLPPLVGGLGLAAVFSAEVSTCDAILFMLATSLSQDLYKRFMKPGASDREVLSVARVASAIGGAMGVALAIVLPPSVIGALSIFYSLLAVSLFVPVIGGLFAPRAGSREAFAAIGAGLSLRLALQLFNDGRGIGVLDPTLLGTLAAGAAFIITLTLRRTDRS